MYLNYHNRFTLFVKAVLNILSDHKLLNIEDIKKLWIKYAINFLVVQFVSFFILPSG